MHVISVVTFARWNRSSGFTSGDFSSKPMVPDAPVHSPAHGTHTPASPPLDPLSATAWSSTASRLPAASPANTASTGSNWEAGSTTAVVHPERATAAATTIDGRTRRRAYPERSATVPP
jgi:hypothetical protein